MRGRSDDLRTKLNSIKKQAEYDALRNEIAHNNVAVSKLEEETLDLMQKVENDEADIKAREEEVAKLKADVAALQAQIEAQAAEGRASLAEIEAAIAGAEAIIPDDIRHQYQRVIKQRGADAMAPVEDGACHGCYVAVTSQKINDLINAETLVFCQICGRILYLAEQPQNVRKRVTT
jgi:predicted  nucleic acid-binding Zn-ribbon protein